LYVSDSEPAGTNTKLMITATSTENTSKWGRVSYTVSALTRYKVSYNAAGGMGDMASFDASYVEGTKVTVAKNYFVRVGYEFVKWNTASSGRGTDYYPGEVFKPTTDTVLYAQWKKTSAASDDDDVVEIVSGDTVVEVKTDKQIALECIALIEINTNKGNVDDSYVVEGMASTLAAARKAYDALTDAQKELVGDAEYQKLVMLEAIYARKFAENGGTVIPDTDAEEVKYALPEGKIFTLGKYKYKVAYSSDTNGKVYMYGPKSKNIKSVVVPAKVHYGRVTYKVTRISNKAFKNCEKLKTVTCKNKATSIGYEAFYSCNKLNKVKLGGKLKKIEDRAFMACPKLKTVYLGGRIENIGTCAFYGDKKLEAVRTSSPYITSIGRLAFYNIKSNAYIKMPDEYYVKWAKLLKDSKLGKGIRLKTY
ncbi:MAG: leucine-rich repeat protein, partial [Lachnospiraceae bacterium]|nr:leucine-rich repeat protein [Lachnospiraceae bacterium]